MALRCGVYWANQGVRAVRQSRLSKRRSTRCNHLLDSHASSRYFRYRAPTTNSGTKVKCTLIIRDVIQRSQYWMFAIASRQKEN